MSKENIVEDIVEKPFVLSEPVELVKSVTQFVKPELSTFEQYAPTTLKAIGLVGLTALLGGGFLGGLILGYDAKDDQNNINNLP